MKSGFIVLCLILLLALHSCVTIYHRSQLRLLDEPFTYDSITFRTDGYYYNETLFDHVIYPKPLENKSPVSFPVKAIETITFYQDGYVSRNETTWLENRIPDAASHERDIDSILLAHENNGYMNRLKFNRRSKANIWDWGIYRQTGQCVELQYYSNHFGNYRLITLQVSILSDTTLLATHQYSPYIGLQPNYVNYQPNLIYKFRQFPSKPDSVNYLRDNLHKFIKLR